MQATANRDRAKVAAAVRPLTSREVRRRALEVIGIRLRKEGGR